MSNQVYSNDLPTSKYFNFPGLNAYGISSFDIDILSGEILNFGAVVINEPQTDIISFDGTGRVTVLKPGMYSIQYIIVITPKTGGDDVQASGTIQLTRPGIFADMDIASVEQKWVNSTVIPSSRVKFILNYTGYFHQGDNFIPFVFNWYDIAVTGKITISNLSRFFISQIY